MSNKFYLIALYVILINGISAVLTLTDKARAKSGKWRISEKTLFLTAILGGAVCEYLTMLLIRHKTKHSSFMLGLPVIIILQFILVIFIIFKVAV